MDISIASFSCNKSFILSQDLSDSMASVTNVHVNPLNFALASLAGLSFVRSAAVSMSGNHSSSLVELYSLKQLCPAVMGWLGLFVSVWYTRCLCIGVSLL